MTSTDFFFDAHCHLQDGRITAVGEMLERAEQAGVQMMCCNATTPSDWAAVELLARRFPSRLLPAFGVHPWYSGYVASGWSDDLEVILTRWTGSPIGEAGLDYACIGADRREQRHVLRAQLALAEKLDRPLILHARKAWGDLLPMLRDASLPGGFMVHAFGGSGETAAELISLGGLLSFGASLTRPRCQRVAAVLKSLPRERILLESDAPDMLPTGANGMVVTAGKPLNEPANISYAARAMAELLDEPISMIRNLTTHNARRLFRLEH